MDISWINENIAVGPVISKEKIKELKKNGLNAIIDVRSECCDDEDYIKNLGMDFLHINIDDTYSPTIKQLKKVTDFVAPFLAENKKIYIHCQNGYGRSPLVAMSILIHKGITNSKARAIVANRHPWTSLSVNQEKFISSTPYLTNHNLRNRRVKTNIFLTGPPSSGKTTVIKKVIKSLKIPANGFYTEEERIGKKRVGFLIKTLDGNSGYLAHQNIQSRFHVGRYGVSIENIEELLVPSIDPTNNNIIILDEIGKMECFSDDFKESVLVALNSHNIVIGTITSGRDNFIQEIKNRKDVEIIKLTLHNRDLLPNLILEKL